VPFVWTSRVGPEERRALIDDLARLPCAASVASRPRFSSVLPLLRAPPRDGLPDSYMRVELLWGWVARLLATTSEPSAPERRRPDLAMTPRSGRCRHMPYLFRAGWRSREWRIRPRSPLGRSRLESCAMHFSCCVTMPSTLGGIVASGHFGSGSSDLGIGWFR
jgi:hypothetical protein